MTHDNYIIKANKKHTHTTKKQATHRGCAVIKKRVVVDMFAKGGFQIIWHATRDTRDPQPGGETRKTYA